MNKKFFLMFLLIAYYYSLNAYGFIDSLNEKKVMPIKDVDQKCLDVTKSSNMTERCEFFKCFEERFPCGKEYWIMNWGFKYCRRYADPEFVAKFTKIGKKLLEHVNKCLPKHFEKAYKSKRMLRCKKLYNEAFAAQIKCYVEIQNDFCRAFTENKDLFVKVLDHSDLLNFESISMIRKATEKCTPKIDFLSLISGK